MLSPAELDRVVERALVRRWPRFGRELHASIPLYLACAFLLAAIVMVLSGPPSSYAAAVPVGGALGLIIGFLIGSRRKQPD